MDGTSNGRRETAASEDGEVVLELVEDVPLDDEEDVLLVVDEGLLVLVLLDDEGFVLVDDGELVVGLLLLVGLLVGDVLLEDEDEPEPALPEDESDEDTEESVDVGTARVYVEDPSTVVSPVAPPGAKVISGPPTSDTRVT